MLDRQFLHRIVQFFLELLHEQLAISAFFIGQLVDNFG
jgi:hypothetical protein